MTVRIVPRLDIKGPNLVKGVHLEGLRVLGKPEWAAEHYYLGEADELVYMDVVASLYQRNSLMDIVRETSKAIFIPLTVGGGLRSIGDIREVLRSGADKVALNTGALRNPDLVYDAARRFGSSTIVISIEAKTQADGTFEAYTDNGRERTGRKVLDWAIEAADRGAGEILLTSVDREGTGKGFDLALVRAVAEAVPIPVIACGGAGRLDHVSQVVREGGADAVSVASMLHYRLIKEKHPGSSTEFIEGNLEYLESGGGVGAIEDATILDIKNHLMEQGVPCRPPMN